VLLKYTVGLIVGILGITAMAVVLNLNGLNSSAVVAFLIPAIGGMVGTIGGLGLMKTPRNVLIGGMEGLLLAGLWAGTVWLGWPVLIWIVQIFMPGYPS
jgi:hypothetical protein